MDINGEFIPIKYKNNNNSFGYQDKSVDSENSKKIYKKLSESNYSFYFNFPNEGIYTIKIIFKKKLSSCAGLFYHCENIIEIDMSKFDCTKVLSCNGMFWQKKENKLQKINLGKLDFSFVSDFRMMFCECCNLVELDVTNFNTKNSKSFQCMFSGCEKLVKIDVSKFNTSKCENIYGMFINCYCISEIDMINWDMSNLKYENENRDNPIGDLFHNCKKLQKIKISGNLKKGQAHFGGDAFYGIPQTGELITRKNIICNIPLDGCLPKNWQRIKE